MNRKLSLLLPCAVVAALALSSTAVPTEESGVGREQPAQERAASEVRNSHTAQVALTFRFRDMPLEDVLAEVRRLSGANVETRGRAATQLIPDLAADGVPVVSVLAKLARENQLVLLQPSRPGEAWMLLGHPDYAEGLRAVPVERKVLALNHLRSEEAVRAVMGLLTTDFGSITYQTDSRRIAVRDQPYVLEAVEARLRELDS